MLICIKDKLFIVVRVNKLSSVLHYCRQTRSIWRIQLLMRAKDSWMIKKIHLD